MKQKIHSRDSGIDLTGRRIGRLCNPKNGENEEKQTIRAKQGSVKYTNMCNSNRRRGYKERAEKLEVMAENSPNLVRCINLHIQEVQ